ncbi:MAG: protease complex subunit PrcB family protein [Bacteroidota bacterium]
MIYRFLSLGLSALLIIGWGCKTSSSARSDERALEIEVLFEGDRGAEKASEMILTNKVEWEQWWQGTQANADMPSEYENLDFDRYMLVAVSAGTKSSGGFSTSIQAVKVSGETLMVDVVDVQPGPNCFVTMAITYPVCVVKVKKVAFKQSEFRHSSEKSNC